MQTKLVALALLAGLVLLNQQAAKARLAGAGSWPATSSTTSSQACGCRRS